jgi:hypothetical protein
MDNSICFICCDFDSNRSEIVFLECLHSMCNLCLAKLQQKICPYCRTIINEKNINDVKCNTIERVSIFQPVIRIQIRRRRRRTITERIDDDRNIIIETPYKNNRKKHKRPKLDNKRKSKWGKFRATIFGH